MFIFKAQPRTINDQKTMKRRSQNESGVFKKPNLQQKPAHFIEIGPPTKKTDVFQLKNDYFYVDRPSEPVYVPLDSKIDKATQIERKDWLLFDFDREVEPLLEVLIPKVLEQAHIEIVWENTVANKNKDNAQYELIRNAQIHKTQRQLYRQKRLDEERANRAKQHDLSIKFLLDTHQKMHARGLAKRLINNLDERHYKVYNTRRFLGIEVQCFTNGALAPYCVNGVAKAVDRANSVKHNIVDRINGVVNYLLANHSDTVTEHRQHLEQLRLEEQARIQNKERIETEVKRISSVRKIEKRNTI